MISVEHLNFSYPCGRQILREISFEAPSGSCLAILGNNGAGKSTFLKCLCHILRPQTGRAMLDGVDLLTLPPRRLAEYVALMSQEPPSARLTVYDTLMLGRRPYIRWGVGQQDRSAVSDMLARLHLEPMAARYLDQLSGGERQKVLLGRALVQQPKLLLLDEPTSALDLRNQYEMLSLVRRMCAQTGITAVLVLHDLNLALRFCDRLLLLSDGAVHACGGAEIMTSESIRAVYGMDASVRTVDGIPVVLPHMAEQ